MHMWPMREPLGLPLSSTHSALKNVVHDANIPESCDKDDGLIGHETSKVVATLPTRILMFKDAVGRKFIFPYDTVKNWAVSNNLINLLYI